MKRKEITHYSTLEWDAHLDWDDNDRMTPHKLCLACGERKVLSERFESGGIGYLSVCDHCFENMGAHYGWDYVAKYALGAAEWMQFRHNRGTAYYHLDPEFFSVLGHIEGQFTTSREEAEEACYTIK